MSTSNELHLAKIRFAELQDEARRTAALALKDALGLDFHIGAWGTKARQAFTDQWPTDLRRPEVRWDWEEIFRRHRDPDRLEMVIWAAGDRLSAIGLGLCTGQAVNLRFLEGDPRADCPLKKRRSLIALECSHRYAQGRGRKELRVQPVNAALESLYRDVYGFSLEAPRGQAPYWRRGV